MKINPKYKDKIISLPSSQVLDNLMNADEAKLKVLIYAMSDLSASCADIARATGLEKDEVTDALLFWKSKDAISVTGLRTASAKKKKEEAPSPRRKSRRGYFSRWVFRPTTTRRSPP